MANILRRVLTQNVYQLNGLNANKIAFIAIRNCGWVRDWKPGEYPKTKEEREAAAKKYNLIPEDYEPYPEGSGTGDYPKLPPVGQDARDPYEDFDYHYRRLNFGETLHKDYEIYTSDHHNPNEELRFSPLTMYMQFLGLFTAIFMLGLISEYFDLRHVWPLKPKQYPKPGVIHYTFEPLD